MNISYRTADAAQLAAAFAQARVCFHDHGLPQRALLWFALNLIKIER